jgi:chromate transport protein ChrA
MFIVKFIAVMISVILADIAWTLYFMKVQEEKPVASGVWAALIVIFGAFTVTEYTNDWRMIIAAIIGSFIGTAGTVEWKRRKNAKQELKKGKEKES